MIEGEIINFDKDKYGDYISHKIEIKSKRNKGVHAKENMKRRIISNRKSNSFFSCNK